MQPPVNEKFPNLSGLKIEASSGLSSLHQTQYAVHGTFWNS